MKLQAAAIVVLWGVSPVHTPTFLTNKVISAASVVFLLRAALGHVRGDQEQTPRESWPLVLALLPPVCSG